jgi:hypothetical protein
MYKLVLLAIGIFIVYKIYTEKNKSNVVGFNNLQTSILPLSANSLPPSGWAGYSERYK